ncbi:TRAFAC clade GTPase domain-containing protein [Pseudosporangium ferrugineum]|uniref:Double-GTPase 1 domain-containing protein n=1 Tax=Pseudosporangium ferrugineum TaxID=439699 RepID=A0A2T0RFQ2_9ACTN|nr:hypothetical protein CLV70_12623 [Pseudosporangium ferrugineum]
MELGRESRRVLVLGSAAAGKTTFLVQLHGRVSAGKGELRARTVSASLSAIEEGYKRLQQGLAVGHTPHGTDTSLSLAAVDLDGRLVDVSVPDYAGEDLRSLVHDRRVPDRWRSEASSSDQWLLMIRLSRYPDLPDLLVRPIGELAQASFESEEDDPYELPVDMWAVELLQALLHTRRVDSDPPPPPPRLTLVLSCWDELGESPETRPSDVARRRLSLLHSFCSSTWGGSFEVAGLSAQGKPLDENAPADDYLDAGPQQMGWVVTAGGERNPDLTLLVHSR